MSKFRTSGVLGLAIALAALTTTALSATSNAGAGNPAAPAAADELVPLPGLSAPVYDVTLLTGDHVRLADAGGGRYSVTAAPAGASPAIHVNARGDRSGTTAITALPVAAEALVTSGVLDSNLFDVRYLAERGSSGIPVTVQYAGVRSSDSLRGKAAGLPGATLGATHPDDGTVDLTVAPAKAGAFWAAITGGQHTTGAYLIGRPAPTLAGGATRAWPTGHRGAAATPVTDQPSYQVRVMIKHSKGDRIVCDGVLGTMCLGPQSLLAVAGTSAGHTFGGSVTCADNPCTTYVVGYRVPAGVYAASGSGWFYSEQRSEHVDLLAPQFTVAGDTAITIDVDAAQQITFRTPRPSQPFVGQLSDYRGLPDGTWFTNLYFAQSPDMWATPSSQPVTVGSFHLSSGWVIGKPLLSMTVAAPQRLDLDAMYFNYRPADLSIFKVVRFDGQQRRQLVDAGYGRPEDFDGLDAQGKLVLVRVAHGGGSCEPATLGEIQEWQFANAIKAGAAGMVVEAASPEQEPDGWCALPVTPYYSVSGAAAPDLPFAEITVEKANALISLLAHGPVTIDVSSYAGDSPYVYTPRMYHEGLVPSSLQTTLRDSQLAAVTNQYHADQPHTFYESWGAFRPDEYVAGGTTYEGLGLPATITEYHGPLSPDTVYARGVAGQRVYEVASRPGPSTEHWGAEPAVLGATSISADVLRAQPGKFSNAHNFLSYCDFCRQGDTFYPIAGLVSGAAPALNGGAFGFRADAIQLYRDGAEIPGTAVQGIETFPMAAEPAGYQLVARYGGSTTTWDFRSVRPPADVPPPGYACYGTLLGSTEPCAPDPLVYLRYDAHTALDNTISAGDRHQLDVTAYHLVAGAPAITGLRLSISTDGGTTWQPLHTVGQGGSYSASYTVRSGDTLSIKAQARDAGGNAINQTLLDAVKIAK